MAAFYPSCTAARELRGPIFKFIAAAVHELQFTRDKKESRALRRHGTLLYGPQIMDSRGALIFPEAVVGNH